MYFKMRGILEGMFISKSFQIISNNPLMCRPKQVFLKITINYNLHSLAIKIGLKERHDKSQYSNENRFLSFLTVDIRDIYILKKVFEICPTSLKKWIKNGR